MKKILTLFAVVGLFAFSSCEGPEGPQGPEGPVYESEVFEVGPDFTAANGYSVTYPLNPVMLSGDNILVYELVSTSGVDTWALLPQVYYFNNGLELSLIHISEPTRLLSISYAVFCLKNDPVGSTF